MKRKWYAVLSMLIYILFLAWAWGFDISKLLDWKLFLQLLMGAFLLTLPFYREKVGWRELLPVFGKKALEAGYIQTFLLLFICMSDGEIRVDIVMHFRPVLYGFCLFVFFMQKDEEEETEQETERKLGVERIEMTSSDAYEVFRQKGLTKRESEIALLICKGCSNREIAEEFVISETTVKKHVSNIFEKTGIEKREELRKMLRDSNVPPK